MPDVGDERDQTAAPSEWIEVRRCATAARADEYALVLQAMGIRSAIAQNGTEYELIVQLDDAERAREQLHTFTRENHGWPPQPVVLPPVTMGVGAALVYAALMVIAFAAQQQGSYGVDWLSIGSADAGLIRHGEWWRAITALSLHGDAVHLAGNVLFGALFGVMLAQSVGAGSAWLTFLVAGGLGNLTNAWWQLPAHSAIGASTGVFGLLGAQAACDWMRRGRVRLHPMRRWAPIIMGVALLAWFGGRGSDELRRVDVSAHVFGFCAGLGMGALLAHRATARLMRPRGQNALIAAALMLVVLAWAIALSF